MADWQRELFVSTDRSPGTEFRVSTYDIKDKYLLIRAKDLTEAETFVCLSRDEVIQMAQAVLEHYRAPEVPEPREVLEESAW